MGILLRTKGKIEDFLENILPGPAVWFFRLGKVSITECFHLPNAVAPDWISVVTEDLIGYFQSEKIYSSSSLAMIGNCEHSVG